MPIVPIRIVPIVTVVTVVTTVAVIAITRVIAVIVSVVIAVIVPIVVPVVVPVVATIVIAGIVAVGRTGKIDRLASVEPIAQIGIGGSDGSDSGAALASETTQGVSPLDVVGSTASTPSIGWFRSNKRRQDDHRQKE